MTEANTMGTVLIDKQPQVLLKLTRGGLICREQQGKKAALEYIILC